MVTLNVFDDDVGRDRPMGSATMHWEELMCEGEHCLKMHGQRNDAFHRREMHFLKFHKSRMEKHARARRPVLVSIARCRGWFLFRVRAVSDDAVASTRALPRERARAIFTGRGDGVGLLRHRRDSCP